MVELGLFLLGLMGFLVLLAIPIIGPIIIYHFSSTAGFIAATIQIILFLSYCASETPKLISKLNDKIKKTMKEKIHGIVLFKEKVWKNFKENFSHEDFRYMMMNSSEEIRNFYKKRMNDFFETGISIGNSDAKEKQWIGNWNSPSLKKNEKGIIETHLRSIGNYWGTYGEMLTSYFLINGLGLNVSQLKWVEDKDGIRSPDLEINFYGTKVFCEIATLSSAQSLGFSIGNLIEDKIRESLDRKFKQTVGDFPNIFIVVIKPGTIPGIYEHDSLIFPLLGIPRISKQILGKKTLTTVYWNGKFKKNNTSEDIPAIFAKDELSKILSAVIYIQESGYHGVCNEINGAIILNPETNKPIPTMLYERFKEHHHLYLNLRLKEGNFEGIHSKFGPWKPNVVK